MFNLTINAVPASTIIVGRRATWLDRMRQKSCVIMSKKSAERS